MKKNIFINNLLGNNPVTHRGACLIFLIGLLFLQIGCITNTHARQELNKTWELTVESMGNGENDKINIGPTSRLHVRLRNISLETQRIWKETNSWGYATISFELTAIDGKKIKLHRKERGWRKNIPTFNSIELGTSHVWQFSLTAEQWDGVTKLKQGQTYLMKAILHIPEDNETRKYRIWTGKVSSGEVKIIYH